MMKSRVGLENHTAEEGRGKGRLLSLQLSTVGFLLCSPIGYMAGGSEFIDNCKPGTQLI